MSSVVISGDTSGTVTVAAPAVAGSNTLTLQAATATSAVNTLATAVASTSGTSIDFTGLPAWVKRITVMFSGVSTSGTSTKLVQIGSGSIVTTGYLSTGSSIGSASAGSTNSTTGFLIYSNAATDLISGTMILNLVSGNTWIYSLSAKSFTTGSVVGGGDITLSGVLDRVRITTTNGTDTFDAGTINILYEG